VCRSAPHHAQVSTGTDDAPGGLERQHATLLLAQLCCTEGADATRSIGLVPQRGGQAAQLAAVGALQGATGALRRDHLAAEAITGAKQVVPGAVVGDAGVGVGEYHGRACRCRVPRMPCSGAGCDQVFVQGGALGIEHRRRQMYGSHRQRCSALVRSPGRWCSGDQALLGI